MEELGKLILSLPPSALLVFAAVLALVVGSKFTGRFLGAISGPEHNPAQAQVAAVIVDNTVLKAAVENLCESLDNFTAELNDTRSELHGIRNELRDVVKEMIRFRA